jgi:hypothetical protein
MLFERRATEQRLWPAIEQLVEAAVAAGGDPRMVLERILSDVQAIATDEMRQTNAYRWPEGTIRTNLKLVKDLAALLDTVVTGVSEKRRATDAHYRRR